MSRRQQCSYQQINARVSPTRTTDGTRPTGITWLLDFTDPSAFGTSESLAREVFVDSELCDMLCLSMLGWPEPTLENEASCVASLPELFPGTTMELSEDYPLKTISSPLLSKQVEELVVQLSKTHQVMVLRNATNVPDFDISLAKSVFTVPNLEYFLGVYAYSIRSYHPILHVPTFRYEQVSLPLLLAIFLLGALFSAPMDHAVSARHFFHISEEFIFDHPNFRQLLLGRNTPKDPTIESVEILQAALTILIIQSGINDQLTRRRIRVEKNPLLSAAVRLSGVLRIKHRISITDYTAKDWTLFIQYETCIR
ncbi:Transcription factor [Penicillium hordei]|uniref:Transcription factor n=1 Tax=Penicillium hordei TaxID=40994 RepID=A0AAD6EAZ2_9EURO|nr:Transcription factor [Penicillium hordei]KAJ5607685.1 Transcription factor [Penicillium hordei]